MKTSPMLMVGLALLLSGSAFGRSPAAPDVWTSMKIDQTSGPVFPQGLLLMGITRGEADLVITTDASGKLEDWLVVGYTRREFAEAAVAAVKDWKFTPARLRGEPVGTTVDLHFHFAAEGVVVSSVSLNDSIEAEMARVFGIRYQYRLCSLRNLDRVPVPVTVVAPLYPKQLADRGEKGRVTVEFYIDESGAVRLPAVVSKGNNLDLGSLALAALSHWKFAPPTSHGRPVLIRASQDFIFGNGS